MRIIIGAVAFLLLSACSTSGGPEVGQLVVHELYTESAAVTIAVGEYVQVAAREGARGVDNGFYWINRINDSEWAISDETVIQFGMPSPDHWPGVKYVYGSQPGKADVCAEYSGRTGCVGFTVTAD